MTVETARLVLRPWDPMQLLTLIESPQRFAEVGGVPAAAGLREMCASGDVSPDWLAALRADNNPDPWRHGFLIVHRGDNVAIGTAGFKGPADANGIVEIAYGIAPGYEGLGFATEAAAALVEWALATPAVRLVRAQTLPEKNASTQVLTRCGFTWLGAVIDPDDGEVWRWERSR